MGPAMGHHLSETGLGTPKKDCSGEILTEAPLELQPPSCMGQGQTSHGAEKPAENIGKPWKTLGKPTGNMVF